jgi:hypothetical protein
MLVTKASQSTNSKLAPIRIERRPSFLLQDCNPALMSHVALRRSHWGCGAIQAWHARCIMGNTAMRRTRRFTRSILIFAAAALLRPAPVVAASVDSVPPLAPPTGAVVNVSTESQLQQAVASLRSDTTIVLASGSYVLTSTLYVNGTFTNVGIRGATNQRDDVVLVGQGMTNASYGAVPYGIWVGGNVRGVTIANLTIRGLYYHPIVLNAGTEDPLIYNVHLIDAGQQFVKANPDTAGGGVDRGRVEYSVVEYSTTSRDAYTNGVDVHTGTGWIVRSNLFRNIRAPGGLLAGPAILMWNGTSGSTVEGNTFIDCQREIAMGLIERTPNDHSGGIVRNNYVYRSPAVSGDVAIGVYDSPGTQVLHNTVLISGTYANAIEYRFPDTTGVLVANNLLDALILARDGATGTSVSNLTTATTALLVNPSAGDPHLRSTATAAIDRASATGGTTVDWDGDARPFGAASDLGADEYRIAASVPSAPQNVRIVR